LPSPSRWIRSPMKSPITTPIPVSGTANALATLASRVSSPANAPAASLSLCPTTSHPYRQPASLIFAGGFLFFSIYTVRLLPPLLPHTSALPRASGGDTSRASSIFRWSLISFPSATKNRPLGDGGVLSVHEAVFPVLHRYRISLDEQRHFRGRIPSPSLLYLLLLWLPADLPQSTICVLALSASTPSLFQQQFQSYVAKLLTSLHLSTLASRPIS
ncbi:hypothetical protein B296_00048782, partial [Ensete ventricosum]